MDPAAQATVIIRLVEDNTLSCPGTVKRREEYCRGAVEPLTVMGGKRRQFT